MAAYVLLLCAAAWHALEIGTIGDRGRIVHTLTGIGFVAGLFTGWPGYVGVAGALVTVLAARQVGRWLAAGGWLILAITLWRCTRTAFTWAARLTVDAVLNTLALLAPRVSPPLPHEAHAGPQCQPPCPRCDTAQPALDDTPWPAQVQTWWDWLGTAVETCGGYERAAEAALAKWGNSRSKFARDLAKIRSGAVA